MLVRYIDDVLRPIGEEGVNVTRRAADCWRSTRGGRQVFVMSAGGIRRQLMDVMVGANIDDVLRALSFECIGTGLLSGQWRRERQRFGHDVGQLGDRHPWFWWTDLDTRGLGGVGSPPNGGRSG